MDRSETIGIATAVWVKTAAANQGVSLRDVARQAEIKWPTFVRRLAGVNPFSIVELDRVAGALGSSAAAVLSEVQQDVAA